MLEIKHKKDCTGCSACYSICPVNAIELQEDNEGFCYPVIDEKKCIKCNICEKKCPCINGDKSSKIEKPQVLAAWSLDNKNKEQSSSGGCFYELAKYVLKNNGVVVGAGFNKELDVIHKLVDNEERLIELKGSKYVQSYIGDTYSKVKEALKEDKKVLFVGTPCQVAGLYSFLGNQENNNLYTADLICHGVPSPKVYRKYLEELCTKYNAKATNINFRSKISGWKKFSMKIDFDNAQTYLKSLNEDLFMKGFLNNIYLRPSCYDCKFAKIPRVADITLGDFWGIGDKKSELDDDTGTSELIINSDKGRKLLSEIKENLYIEEIDLEYGIKVNPCLVGSVKEPKQRKRFFEEVDKKSFETLCKKYNVKEKFLYKTYIVIVRILSKIKRVMVSLIKKPQQ